MIVPPLIQLASPGRGARLLLLFLFLLPGALGPDPARAQSSVVVASAADSAWAALDRFVPMPGMGLPKKFAPYAGFALATDHPEGGRVANALAFAGFRHDSKMPAIGALGFCLEAYGGTSGEQGVFGGRVLASIRALRLKTGVDYSSLDPGAAWVLTLEDPILRGGFPLRGSTTRIEWIPARGHLGLGVAIPLFQPWIGRTRPRKIQVELADLPADARTVPARRAVAPDSLLAESAQWIDFLTTPSDPAQLGTNEDWMRYLERVLRKIETRDAAHPSGQGLPQAIEFYHRRLRSEFGAGERSGLVCDAARRIVLERLIAPYDAEFGRLRRDKVFDALAGSARDEFATWCDTSGAVPPAERESMLRVFDSWLGAVHGVERKAHRRWDDTRKIWLPFDLALRPEEHDSQAEIDALIERLLGGRFQGGNSYQYLVNEAFSPALIQSIRDATDYHVLWIHDFPGQSRHGSVDSVGCAVVTRGYLRALADAARRLDATGHMPVYVIMLDQWYFDARKGAWWMRVLEDPLGAGCHLPKSARAQRDAVLSAQAQLRAAVDSSRTLRELRTRHGEGWLRRFVSVRVNITFPGDPSFAGRGPVPTFVLKFSDDYMRDHSKVVFWDLTEENPTSGAAILTGEGVGENYEGSGWEDRSLLLRGPGALEFKRRARELLESQGFRPDQIPLPLRARPLAADWQSRVDSLIAGGNTTRVLQAFNGTGYQRKSASALKAALYNLMPAGSRILAPDSQWSSYYWAGMLVGAALRGVHVYAVAARTQNAPYGDAPVQNILTHDVLEGYVQLRGAFAEPLAASGGSLSVGVYGEGIGTRSLVDRYRSVLGGMQDPRFPRSAFPLPDSAYAALANPARFARVMRPLLALPKAPTPPAGLHPKLHLKCQLFMSGAAISRLTRAANWDSVVALYAADRVRATLADPQQAGTGMMSPALLAPLRPVLFEASPESTAADVYYLTIGSHNQNDRSLLLDGELLCVLAGPEALAPVVDFLAIAARSRWIDAPAELDREIPRYSRGQVNRARRLRYLF